MTRGDLHLGVDQQKNRLSFPGRHSKAHCSHKDEENVIWIWSLFFLHILSHMDNLCNQVKFSRDGFLNQLQAYEGIIDARSSVYPASCNECKNIQKLEKRCKSLKKCEIKSARVYPSLQENFIFFVLFVSFQIFQHSSKICKKK